MIIFISATLDARVILKKDEINQTINRSNLLTRKIVQKLQSKTQKKESIQVTLEAPSEQSKTVPVHRSETKKQHLALHEDTEDLNENIAKKENNEAAKITSNPELNQKSKTMRGKKALSPKGKKLQFIEQESNVGKEIETDKNRKKESPLSKEVTGMRRRQRTIRPEEPFQEFTFLHLICYPVNLVSE